LKEYFFNVDNIVKIQIENAKTNSNLKYFYKMEKIYVKIDEIVNNFFEEKKKKKIFFEIIKNWFFNEKNKQRIWGIAALPSFFLLN
jgi:hypothetical protein